MGRVPWHLLDELDAEKTKLRVLREHTNYWMIIDSVLQVKSRQWGRGEGGDLRTKCQGFRVSPGGENGVWENRERFVLSAKTGGQLRNHAPVSMLIA